MPKFKVTATMDVGYELIVEADNEAEAWRMAEDEDADWLQVDEGHDWTLENVYEVEDKTKYPEWKVVDPYFTEKKLKERRQSDDGS
jgi:hypothetical protein|tara:strand:- start:255 stop:512 length:258 start_codon:yes stop_codon:yes gene_type:complete